MNDSHEGTKPQKDKEEIAAILVDCAFRLHRDSGPGLLETVYEVVLAKMLRDQGLEVERQKPIPIQYAGFTAEELDFPPAPRLRRAGILNYDIKYRMGRDPEEEME